MLLHERELHIPPVSSGASLLRHLAEHVLSGIREDDVPVRIAVSRSDSNGHDCEVGVLSGLAAASESAPKSVFEFVPRSHEHTDAFTAVLVVPTGIGAEIGGHAGDAAPVARLLASACDALITHPNVVNASDINELPENGLYVEGSVLARLLMGTIGLQRVRSNRVMLIIDEHPESCVTELAVNAASAARAAMGVDCPRVVRLDPPIEVESEYTTSGSAVGRVEGLERLLAAADRYRDEYDALALASVISVPEESHKDYVESQGDMVNPWGGAEAMLTHAVSLLLDVPSAHAPMMESLEVLNTTYGVVDPRLCAEDISNSFLFSVLKGLHRSPRIITDWTVFGQKGILSASDVSCLVIPDGCVGLPTLAALEQGIPVIAVRENKHRMRNDLRALPFATGKLHIVENYLEAAGVMTAMRAGVSVSAVRRPLAATRETRLKEGAIESKATPAGQRSRSG